ncbi:MAG: glycosyltransferase family 4 protein, partial [Candidatus Heimdallarchaeota archaeon]
KFNQIIIRYGNKHTSRLYFWLYHRKLRGKFDIIVESQNGVIPWFSRFFLKAPAVQLFHHIGMDYSNRQLYNSVFPYELPIPLAIIAYHLEPVILKLMLGVPVIAVSRSTKESLLELGYSNKDIVIIHSGFTTPSLDFRVEKRTNPSLIYLGRLSKLKRVEDCIVGFYFIKRKFKEAQLTIVGEGDKKYVDYLKSLVRKLELVSSVFFKGYVNDKEKLELLGQSHILLVSSYREGWGIVVIEANYTRTIAIGYDIPGLRDSIQNGRTGILVKNQSPKYLAKAVIQVFKEEERLTSMADAAEQFSLSLSWDRAARAYLMIMSFLLTKKRN